MPRPSEAPVSSAATRVVSAADRPRRAPVRMKGVEAGMTTRKKMSRSVAPRMRAALMRVTSTLHTPW